MLSSFSNIYFEEEAGENVIYWDEGEAYCEPQEKEGVPTANSHSI